MPYIKILLLLFFSLLNFQSATAQLSTDDRAIIYYKDGSVFIGQIVAEDALQIQLVVSTMDTLNVTKEFIKRILRNSTDVLIHQGGKIHYSSGKFVSTSLGFAISENPSFEWDIILGKRLNRRVSAGIGASFNINSVSNFNGFWIDNNFVPVFAYGRYYISQRKARFFAAAKIGYGIATTLNFGSQHSGGVYFQPSIGIHFASRKYARFIIVLGQTLQYTSGNLNRRDRLGNPILLAYKYWYNRTMLKIGMEFK